VKSIVYYYLHGSYLQKHHWRGVRCQDRLIRNEIERGDKIMMRKLYIAAAIMIMALTLAEQASAQKNPARKTRPRPSVAPVASPTPNTPPPTARPNRRKFDHIGNVTATTPAQTVASPSGAPGQTQDPAFATTMMEGSNIRSAQPKANPAVPAQGPTHPGQSQDPAFAATMMEGANIRTTNPGAVPPTTGTMPPTTNGQFSATMMEGSMIKKKPRKKGVKAKSARKP
jgi:hypothetical protein